MPSPFPGMDAYLEQPVYWSEFHSRLIVAIADTLAPSLRPRYYIRVETRTYLDDANDDLLVGIPDAAVVLKERYLEVRERGTDAVITVIEVLSPKNKRKGKGRDRYQQKRQTILGSLSHLIEIDLLRRYEPMAMMGEAIATDYRILISRSRQRPFADLYGFMLRELIPSFPLPLGKILTKQAKPPLSTREFPGGSFPRQHRLETSPRNTQPQKRLSCFV